MVRWAVSVLEQSRGCWVPGGHGGPGRRLGGGLCLTAHPRHGDAAAGALAASSLF